MPLGESQDLVALLRTQRELLTLPADPHARTLHALASLRDLLHTHGGIFIRVDETPGPQPFQITETIDLGIEKAAERPRMVNFYIEDPPNPLQLPIMTAPAAHMVLDRRDIMSDTAWHNCGFYTDISRKVRAEEIMCVRSSFPGMHRHYGIALFRPPGDPAFSARDRQLFSLFFQQMLPIFRQKPARAVRAMHDLPPRFVPIVEGLIAGDSPRQIALKLNCSIHTVYGYTKQLYKIFDVGSRGEFLARWHALHSSPVMVHA